MEKKLNDTSLQEVITLIENKQTELQKEVKKFEPITNMNLELFGQRHNLHVCDKQQLIFLYAFLNSLNQNKYQVVLNGFSIFDWIKDIESRIYHIDIKTQLEQLKVKRNTLEAMFTESHRNQVTFDNILASLDIT